MANGVSGATTPSRLDRHAPTVTERTPGWLELLAGDITDDGVVGVEVSVSKSTGTRLARRCHGASSLLVKVPTEPQQGDRLRRRPGMVAPPPATTPASPS